MLQRHHHFSCGQNNLTHEPSSDPGCIRVKVSSLVQECKADSTTCFTQKSTEASRKKYKSPWFYWLRNFTLLSCLKQSQSGETTNAAGKNPTISQCHLLGKQDWKNTLVSLLYCSIQRFSATSQALAGQALFSEGRPWIHERRADCLQLSPWNESCSNPTLEWGCICIGKQHTNPQD